ncbi:MAG TPA: hypothetical protein VFR40_04685 [Lapillicoccus sp.]|nr:hypothetical protein [Lapillicoccus sp.]
MTTLTIGSGVGPLRLRGLALAVALGLLVWCGCVLAVAWSSPQSSGSRPAVVLTPEPRPAGY